MPALSDLNNSPAETTSAPNPCVFSKLRIAKLGFALTAK